MNVMRAWRRFRWQAVPKRRRQATYISIIAATAVLTMNHKFKECIEVVGNPARVTNPNTLFWLRMFYGRMRSRWFGYFSEMHVPVAVRPSFYTFFARVYGSNLDEVRYPLDSYLSFQDFFCRALKDNARPIADVPNGLVSPCDATVVALGTIDGPDARIPQVKGATYSVPSFIGTDPAISVAEGNDLRYAVLYLPAGNYHRIHSPCELTFTMGRHFCGETMPMRSWFLNWMPDVFTVSERVVLCGTWRHGQMYVVPVAANNVGNIYLDFDEKLKTNKMRDIAVYCGGDLSSKRFLDGANLNAGSPLGGFRMGSTVVLVFEAPRGAFEWRVKTGDKLMVGEPLAETSAE